MHVGIREIAQLVKGMTDPRDCVSELTIVFRYNIPGTDIFVDVSSVNYPVKTDPEGCVEFADWSRRCAWVVDQLDTAGYYVEDTTDVLKSGPDLCLVFISRCAKTV